MLQIPDKAALANYTGNLQRARWIGTSPSVPGPEHYAYMRLRQDIFEPVIENKFRFDKSAKFFAMGSCFAREIDRALSMLDIDVMSRTNRAGPDSPLGGSGSTNRYNTYAMLNEIKFAFGLDRFNPKTIVAINRERTKFVDMQSMPMGPTDVDGLIAYRKALIEHFALIAKADVFIITLGMVEAWFDHETGQHINLSAWNGEVFELYPGRFEFRALDHADNMANLEEIYIILKTKASPRLKIVVTTSPVPLRATFSGRDVVTANTYSKSTLRSCAEQWCWSHPDDIEYFPSYEMAMNSNPDLVWRHDRIHIQPIFVHQIMKRFVGNYIVGAEDALTNSPQEIEEIAATIAEAESERRAALRQVSPALAANAPDDPIADLLAACKTAFNEKRLRKCVEEAEKIVQIWSTSDGKTRDNIRKDFTEALRFGCVAALRRRDVGRGMALYRQAVRTNMREWSLGLKVARILRRLGEKQEQQLVIEQLRGWSKLHPKWQVRFQEFMTDLANRDVRSAEIATSE